MEVLARERTGVPSGVLQILSDSDFDYIPAKVRSAVAREDNWAELCKWGAVAAGVLCLTSSIAALILTYARHL